MARVFFCLNAQFRLQQVQRGSHGAEEDEGLRERAAGCIGHRFWHWCDGL